MLKEPICLDFYDENNEIIAQHKCYIVKWKTLKKAIQLSKFKEDDEGFVDAVSNLVCELYGNKFTLEELENGADKDQVMTVLQEILKTGNNQNPNPKAAILKK